MMSAIKVLVSMLQSWWGKGMRTDGEKIDVVMLKIPPSKGAKCSRTMKLSQRKTVNTMPSIGIHAYAV